MNVVASRSKIEIGRLSDVYLADDSGIGCGEDGLNS